MRVGTIGAQDQTNVFGFDGLTFTAIGNGGVDEVFVTAGASVDATKLGVGQDRIYLEGSWAQYTKTLQGNQITDISPLVELAKQDVEGPKRFAPFWRLYLAKNPLEGDSADKHLSALKEYGVRLNMEYSR